MGTAYGRAAVELLAGQITALKAGDPLAQVTVLVPSNYAAVSTRRALAARPGGIVTWISSRSTDWPSAWAAGRWRRPAGGPSPAGARPGRPRRARRRPGRVRARRRPSSHRAGPRRRYPRARGVTDDGARCRRCLQRPGPRRRAHRPPCPSRTGPGLARRARPDACRHRRREPCDHGIRSWSTSSRICRPAGAEFARGPCGRPRAVRVNVGLTGDADADRAVLDAHGHAGIAIDATRRVDRAPPRSSASATPTRRCGPPSGS